MNQQLNTNHGPLNTSYLKRIEQTISKAMLEYNRTIAIRIDLRFPSQNESDTLNRWDSPSHFADIDSQVMTRFFASFNAQIQADQKRKRRDGIRTYPCNVRYIWVREKNKEFKDHYHVLLLLNKDAYFFLGRYEYSGSALVAKIRKAWTSALRVDFVLFEQLVYVPARPLYVLDKNDRNGDFLEIWNALLYRVSYFAKNETKYYGNGYRSFGCSSQ